MTRPAADRNHAGTPLAATLTIALAAGLAGAGQDTFAWELIRPSNTGVPGDYTQKIFIDDDDSPWITGYIPFWEEGGVGHFDGTNWRVLGNVDCDQIASPRFNDIIKTDDGIMWIGSDNGLLRFDPAIEPWCVTRFHRGNTPLLGNQIVNLDLAPDGTIWMATQEVGGTAPGGLAQYDPAADTWNFWNTSNGLPWWAGWDDVDYVAVQPDAGGGYTVWFGSGPMGLTTYKDGLFIWYGSPTPPNVDPLPYGILGEDAVDENGNILLSTDRGIARRAPDGTYTIIGGAPAGLTSEISIIQPLSGGRIGLGTFYADVFLWDSGTWTYLGNWGSGSHTYTITEESNGAIWAGGIGGAARYENGAWQRHRLTNSGMIDFFIGAVAHAPNGDVAMTGNAAPGVGGFDILHPDRTWTNANVATYGIGLPWPYPTDNTSALAFRSNNNLLFAPTNNGLREYDGDFSNLITENFDIEHIAFDGNGRAWAATGRGRAFLEASPGDMSTTFLNGDGVPIGNIVDIVADPNDPASVWIGAAFGVAKTDGVTWEEVPRGAVGLTMDSIGYHFTAFDVASDGSLWLGSGRGLFHYDPATGTYDAYNLSNSPLPSDDILDVEVAPDGSVWISMFDHIFPYPGGVARLKDGEWTLWQQGSSPLPHNQINDLEARPTTNGYEMWIATASEAVAVISVDTSETPCPADFAPPNDTLNIDDVLAFLDAFAFGDPTADLTADGTFNIDDVLGYIDAFTAGCP